MRDSNDIMNYFRRSVKRKELRQRRKIANQIRRTLSQKVINLKNETQSKEEWHCLYSELISRLQKVPEYCALRNPKTIRADYPLERFDIYEIQKYRPFINPILQHSHALNMYYAEALVKDYVTEDLIHFRLETAEGILGYQYSKKGIAIQSFKQILKEVSWMMTNAWFKRIHKGE